MKIIIAGSGKIGYALCENLAAEAHDLVIIDNDPEALRNPGDLLDVMTLCGNAASAAVLREAGAGEADLLIAVTSSDELNLLACLLARKLGVKRTIARVRTPEYNEQLHLLREELGLSMVVNPERVAAKEISHLLRFPAATNVEMMARGRIELVEIRLDHDSPLAGRALKDLSAAYKLKVLICSVERDGEVFIPFGDFVLRENDRINMTASPEEMKRFFEKANIYRSPVKSVLVVGGSRIAHYLAEELHSIGVGMTLIEQDRGRCQALSEQLPYATVVCGDGTDEHLLQEEGIDRTGAFVALTGMDEENIISAMYAVSIGVKKVVAKVNKITFPDVLERSGVDSFFSPKTLAANRIVSFVRSMQNAVGGIRSMRRIASGKAEIIEFFIEKPGRVTDQPLQDLQLRPGILIASILRGARVIIPGGGDCIQKGDFVVIATTNPRFDDIEDILA